MHISESGFAPLARRSPITAKRAFDVAVALAALIALSPLLLAVALLVRLTSRGPAIFRHRRVGLGGREFTIYKFRTMVRDAEQRKAAFTAEQLAEYGQRCKLQNDPRVTPLGRFLRKTSLDELPQFVNVLKGQMSVVGPRPVTASELEKFGDCVGLLLSVKPGITGLSQVRGRSDVPFDIRLKLDMQYVQRRSFGMDLKIFLETFRIITTQMGAY